ncbi:MAG: DUF3782 domain-containing protein, partial [bacterium]
MQETDRRMQETDKLVKNLTRQVSGITDSLGRTAEEMVLAAVVQLFRQRHIEFSRIHPRLAAPLNGETMEVDVVGVGPECVVVIEVKHRLKRWDVENILEKLPRFFAFFPTLKRPTLYGGVAGMSIEEGVDRFAYKQGLFVLAPSGDNMQVINDEGFRPKSFPSG